MHKNSVQKLNSHLTDNTVIITDIIQLLSCTATITFYCVNYKKQIKDTIFHLWIFRKVGFWGMEWIDLAQDWDRWRGSFECGNEPSDFTKSGELLDHMTTG